MGSDLDPEEFRAVVDALSRDDRLKLTLIERPFLRGTSLKKDDLLNEAVCRTLLGKRKCPRHVPVMAFLVEVMRSLASHERTKRKREASTDDVEGTEARVAPALGTLPRVASAEEVLIEAQERAEDIGMEDILALFEEDAEASAVLRGLSEDLKGKGLRDHTGLDQGRLDYAKKRIKKVLLARYPDGWRR